MGIVGYWYVDQLVVIVVDYFVVFVQYLLYGFQLQVFVGYFWGVFVLGL